MTAPITAKLFLLSVAPILLVAAALAGGLDWPSGHSNAQVATAVEGDPVACPDGRTFASFFELDGSRFHVLGSLTAMEGRAAVIAGPTGDVPITLSDSAAVSMGLIIGEPVDAAGTIDELGAYIADSLTALCAADATPSPGPTPAPDAPVGTPTPTPAPQPLIDECNRGPGHAGDLRLEIKDGETRIKRGTVLAFTDGMLTVDTPGGPVSVLITSDTDIKGDLSLAAEVRIEGEFDADGNIVAEEARALCPDAAHVAHDDDGDDDDDGDEMDDEDKDDLDEDHDGATPAIPAIPAIPGGSGDQATPAIPAIPAIPAHDFDDDQEDNGNHGHGGGHREHDDDDEEDDD
jgi:hypothetical protein